MPGRKKKQGYNSRLDERLGMTRENKRGRRCLLPDGGRFQKLRGSPKDLTDLRRSKNLCVRMYVRKSMYVR